MSGYLEVKYPLKPNLGLNPFKSWKRQWCILRPSPTLSGVSLAVYCSEAGATAGLIELPSGSVVRRAKSRSRPHAFAVFPVDDQKPRVLLAAQTLQEAQSWMDKIKALLTGGNNLYGSEIRDSFSINILPTELAYKMGVYGDNTLTVSASGMQFTRSHHAASVKWQHIRDVVSSMEDGNRICVLSLDSDPKVGGGSLKMSSHNPTELCAAIRSRRPLRAHNLSKSDEHLNNCTDIEIRRSSWYSGPSDVSLDDIDLVMSKECTVIPLGQLSRCARAPELHAPPAHRRSASDRRSLVSVASGIYEEIPDLPEPVIENVTYCRMDRDLSDEILECGVEEPAYESVAECLYGTAPRPRRRPPPLPPRALTTEPSLSVGRSGSLGALPRADTLPAARGKARSFSVFRKRLKSDSRIVSPKSETSKENKDIEPKKKKFDFAPTKDIFKNFKVNKKMKNLKITGTLTKGETKSCEFLDETVHVTTNRCSKSVECLENEFLDEFDGDLSIEFNDDAVAALALPQEIVDLILRSREQFNKIRLKEVQESDYLPMSPIVPPPPMEHHYIVMSPKSSLV